MKKVLWIIILVAALAALGTAAQRWLVEWPNRTVELVYDLYGLQQLSAESGVPLDQLFADLKAAGVETIAVQPESLGERMLAGGEVPPEVLGELPQDLVELGPFLTLPLAFDAQQFQLVRDAGLKASPKLNTVPWEVEPLWRDAQPELLILSGQGTMDLDELQGSEAVLALVEFAVPRVEAEPDRVVRLHGISAREMRVLSDERILNRYVRAVRERNIRVLYVRPFMEEDGGWQRSLQLLAALGQRLQAAGFELGTAQPFAAWRPSLLLTALAAAGIWAGAVLYGQLLLPGLRGLVLGGGVLAYLASLVLLFREPLLAKQGLALVAAVVFPCLALECQWGGASGPGPQRAYGFPLGRFIRGGHLERDGVFGEDGGVPGREAHACAAHRPGGFYGGASRGGVPAPGSPGALAGGRGVRGPFGDSLCTAHRQLRPAGAGSGGTGPGSPGKPAAGEAPYQGAVFGPSRPLSGPACPRFPAVMAAAPGSDRAALLGQHLYPYAYLLRCEPLAHPVRVDLRPACGLAALASLPLGEGVAAP